MNAKALIPLVAGLGIGGLALKMGLDTLRSARGAEQSTEKTQLWAPKTDLLRGDEITAEMIKPLSFPAAMVPEGAVKEKEQIVGRVLDMDLIRSLPIVEQALLPEGERHSLAVKPGYRAVSVKIDEGSGVDYHLEPGCFVDVVGSFRIKLEGGRQETVARVIIENAEVAAVGQRTDPVSGKEEQDARSSKRKVRAVTLFVKPEDVPRLHITEQEGRIKLCLRSDSGSGESPLLSAPWVSKLELSGQLEPDKEPVEPSKPDEPVVAAAPTPQPVVRTWSVDVYRGNDEKETTTFVEELEPPEWDLPPGSPDTPSAAFGEAPAPSGGWGSALSNTFDSMISTVMTSQDGAAADETRRPPRKPGATEQVVTKPTPEELAQEGLEEEEEEYEEPTE